MAEDSKIEWTTHTFNPWWGCQRVSPACEKCYAETLANRYGFKVWGPSKTTERRFFGDKHWAEPLAWNKAAAKAGVRARVFCASMADVFEVRDDLSAARWRLACLIAETPHLDWLLLTKRPESMVRLASEQMGWAGAWPSNVWAGTTVEDQRRADERIPFLLEVPARVRFLSCEPILGPVNLHAYLCENGSAERPERGWSEMICTPRAEGISWVICGGESGHGARPMHPAWARALRDQCVAAGVPFFFKQFGEWAPATEPQHGDVWHLGLDARGGVWTQSWKPGDRGAPAGRWDRPADEVVRRVGKKAAGRELDGRTWDEMPAVAP